MESGDRIKNRFLDLTLVVGVIMAVYGGLVMVATSSLTLAYDIPAIYPFDFPAYELPLSIYPTGLDPSSETPFASWLDQLFHGAVYFLAWTLYYLGYGGFIGGLISIFVGLGSTQRDAAIRLLQRTAADRRVQVFTAWLVVVVALIGNPPIFNAFISGSVMVVTWLAIAVSLGMLAHRFYKRASSPLAVFVVYPLIVATPVISSMTTALVIPWTTTSAMAMSYSLAVLMADRVLDLSVDTVLALGLERSFRSLLSFWALLAIGVGWLLGLVHLASAYGRGDLELGPRRSN